MLFVVLVGLHMLASTLWVGGMFFAHVALRTAVQVLAPHDRLVLFSKLLPRFFAWVWASIVVLLVTGFALMFMLYGGFGFVGIHVHVMTLVGGVMIVLFVWMYFGAFRRFIYAVTHEDMAHAAGELARIRAIITINLVLGVGTAVLGAAGAYWG